MLLKVIIVVLFVAVLISLGSGFYFLVKDAGNSRRRLLHSLGVRVTLAVLLLGAITYGFVSGKLGSTAPWDRHLYPQHTAPPP